MIRLARKLLFGKADGTTQPRPPLSLHDLLGRPPINLDTPEIQRFLAGKRVMVTGAGGSIGSEICRQAMKFCPGRMVLVERAENNLFEIDRELRHRWIGADIRPCLADICDARRVAQVFQEQQPHVVLQSHPDSADRADPRRRGSLSGCRRDRRHLARQPVVADGSCPGSPG